MDRGKAEKKWGGRGGGGGGGRRTNQIRTGRPVVGKKKKNNAW